VIQLCHFVHQTICCCCLCLPYIGMRLHSCSASSVRCWSLLPDLSPWKSDVLLSASHLPCCIQNAGGKARFPFKHVWGEQQLATVLYKLVSPYFKHASPVCELRLLRRAESAGLAVRFCAPMGKNNSSFSGCSSHDLNWGRPSDSV